MLRRVRIIPLTELISFIDDAKRICSDEDDILYVAVSLRFDIPLWTNDKKLPRIIRSSELKGRLYL